MLHSIDESFNEVGCASLRYKFQGVLYEIILDKEYLSDASNYRADWMTVLDNIVRKNLYSSKPLNNNEFFLMFRINSKWGPGISFGDSTGCMNINKCYEEIWVDNELIHHDMYNTVLLWFHRMIKSV